MPQLIPVKDLVTLQISEVSFDRLTKEFAKSSCEAIFVSAGKIFVGILEREVLQQVPADRVVDSLDVRFERVSVMDGFYRSQDKVQQQNLIEKAMHIFLAKEKCERVVLLGKGGNLIGIYVKVSSEKQQQTIIRNYLAITQLGLRCIGGYLQENQCRDVAVYSPATDRNKRTRADIDTMVIEELLADPRVHLEYVITNTQTAPNKNPICDFDNLDNISVDAVIVPQEDLLDQATYHLRNSNPTKVIPLSKIVYISRAVEMADYRAIEALYNLKQRGIRVLFVATPIVERLKKKTEYQQLLVREKINRIQDFITKIDIVYSRSFLAEQYAQGEWLRMINSGMSSLVPYHTYWRHIDLASELENVVDGIRQTIGGVEDAESRLFVFGDSVTYGRGVKDCDTVPSYLQKAINAHGRKIRVENRSVSASRLPEIVDYLEETDIDSADSVIVSIREGNFSDYLERLAILNHVPFYRARIDFEESVEEYFFDMHHMSPVGAQLLADKCYEHLFEDEILPPTHEFSRLFAMEFPVSPVREYYDPITASQSFKEYIASLWKNKEVVEGTIGSIVMNCNPFTLGHQYLIEKAAEQCSLLYLFVVEEDRSVFPYSERLELVRQGTAHLPNVKVLPSGEFIISNLTFPEYFQKGDLQDSVIDPSEDVELFGRYIAPALGITMRFVGEEPLDKVTLQYNETMQRILPNFGIDFQVIPRKEFDGQVISASLVRKFLGSQDFDSISKIVPSSTLEYLENHFGREETQHHELGSESIPE